ncbi:MAG: hypothetical protein IJN12_00900 [Clostridia bacterium]|nr:hypothetical protein [Clostridia bacterium]
MIGKIIAAVLILSIACGGMFYCLGKYSDVIEELSALSGDVITSSDISDSIDSFYVLETYFEDNEWFISLFIHDSEVEELREQMVEVITLLFIGDRDAAVVAATLFQQRIVSLGEAIIPSFSNIV